MMMLWCCYMFDLMENYLCLMWNKWAFGKTSKMEVWWKMLNQFEICFA